MKPLTMEPPARVETKMLEEVADEVEEGLDWTVDTVQADMVDWALDGVDAGQDGAEEAGGAARKENGTLIWLPLLISLAFDQGRTRRQFDNVIESLTTQ